MAIVRCELNLKYRKLINFGDLVHGLCIREVHSGGMLKEPGPKPTSPSNSSLLCWSVGCGHSLMRYPRANQLVIEFCT
jgi:hypothetical protein